MLQRITLTSTTHLQHSCNFTVSPRLVTPCPWRFRDPVPVEAVAVVTGWWEVSFTATRQSRPGVIVCIAS
jgi:hypothetical protein